jgi:hypothetical protein
MAALSCMCCVGEGANISSLTMSIYTSRTLLLGTVVTSQKINSMITPCVPELIYIIPPANQEEMNFTIDQPGNR